MQNRPRVFEVRPGFCIKTSRYQNEWLSKRVAAFLAMRRIMVSSLPALQAISGDIV
jgi:hypothetical protein